MPHLQNEQYVAIINQYYKVTAEFERLGDHAVNIADLAASLKSSNTGFSPAAQHDVSVLRELVGQILDYAEKAFRWRDLTAAVELEPLVRVASELIIQLKKNHFKRMSSGECDILADAAFSNLMVECKRITDVCSNVGAATVVRVRPDLADHEHLYYESLRTGGNTAFNRSFDAAHELYFGKLEKKEEPGKTEPGAPLPGSGNAVTAPLS